MIAKPDAMLMSVIPGKTEAVQLLAGYLRAFITEPVIEGPQLRVSIVNHVHDLVAIAMGATRDASEVAAGRGVRAARMHAIKADIAQNLDVDVSVDALAARHRISPRYIRKLFEGDDTSFSMGARPAPGPCPSDAHRSPLGSFTISAIAFEAGFGDLSTFNRQFRRHFGVTPSDVRATRPDAISIARRKAGPPSS